MIEFRSFHNSDPPKLVKLWHECELGRGAARGFTSYAFDSLIFAQPYFDPRGLILAVEGDDVIGFVHAGFGCNSDQSDISFTDGVICVVMVHPDFRRQGIGRELVSQAENYLLQAGTKKIQAGAAKPRDPFYFGLYGGCQPDGFLESDPNVKPFLLALGYTQQKCHLIYQRDITEPRDPTNFRIVNVRRQINMAILNQPSQPSWWWMTRLGRLDSLRFLLVPKNGGDAVAGVTIVGLDLYSETWDARAVGLTELFVVEQFRRQGYGQTLLIEIARRLRQEMVTLLEIHVGNSNEAGIATIESAGFSLVDKGIVYTKSIDAC